MHWADQYLGWKYLDKGTTREGIDCLGLLRLYWIEQIQFEIPSFRDVVARSAAVRGIAKYFEPVPIAEHRVHDAVVMNTEVWDGKRWVLAELHVGVCVAPRLVLHAQEGFLTQIDEMRTLRVTRILRPVR